MIDQTICAKVICNKGTYGFCLKIHTYNQQGTKNKEPGF